jgi:hypothetical protein
MMLGIPLHLSPKIQSSKIHLLPHCTHGASARPFPASHLLEVDTMASNSLQTPKQSDDAGSVPKSARKTIRVGHETVEIDVDAVKQFIETVKEKNSDTKN